MKYPEFFRTLCYDIFIASFATYLTALGIEVVWRGLVASVVQLNALLLVSCVSGALVVLAGPTVIQKHKKLDMIFSIVLAGLASALCYQALKSHGSLAILFTAILGVSTFLFLLSMQTTASND